MNKLEITTLIFLTAHYTRVGNGKGRGMNAVIECMAFILTPDRHRGLRPVQALSQGAVSAAARSAARCLSLSAFLSRLDPIGGGGATDPQRTSRYDHHEDEQP